MLAVVGAFDSGHPIHVSALLGLGLMVLVWAYIFGMVPSLLFAFWMERRYTLGLMPMSGRALCISSGCGGVAGLLSYGTAAFVWKAYRGPVLPFLSYLVLGLVTGLIVGGVIRFAERRAT